MAAVSKDFRKADRGAPLVHATPEVAINKHGDLSKLAPGDVAMDWHIARHPQHLLNLHLTGRWTASYLWRPRMQDRVTVLVVKELYITFAGWTWEAISGMTRLRVMHCPDACLLSPATLLGVNVG